MNRAHVTTLLALAALVSLASIAGAQERNAESTTIRVEKELSIPIELRALPSTQCEAVIATSYDQRNTVARVENTVKIEACTVAAGEFTVTIRIRGVDGVVATKDFPQAWRREVPGDLKLSADFPIGENVDLVSARVRAVRCTCSDPPAAE
jgi:hypothetical protein